MYLVCRPPQPGLAGGNAAPSDSGGMHGDSSTSGGALESWEAGGGGGGANGGGDQAAQLAEMSRLAAKEPLTSAPSACIARRSTFRVFQNSNKHGANGGPDVAGTDVPPRNEGAPPGKVRPLCCVPHPNMCSQALQMQVVWQGWVSCSPCLRGLPLLWAGNKGWRQMFRQ